MKKTSILIFCLLLVLLSSSAQAAVLFEDNFDAQSNWTSTQKLLGSGYTTTCYPGSAPCSLPTGWTMMYDGVSYCSGYSDYNTGGPGNNTLNLNNTAEWSSINGAGSGTCNGTKCLTYWDEVCEYMTGDAEDSDGNLGVDLGSEYSEIYISWKVKYKPGFEWDASTGLSYLPFKKIAHIQYWVGHGSPYLYHWENGSGGHTNPFITLTLEYYPNNDEVLLQNIIQCSNGVNDDCTGSPAWPSDYTGDYPHDITTLGNLAGTGPSPNLRTVGTGHLFDGNFHRWEVYVKMNSGIGVRDGNMKIWLDGVQIYDASNHNHPAYGSSGTTNHLVPYVQTGGHAAGWRAVQFGGNNANRYKTPGTCTGTECEQWFAIDDVCISDSYIGNSTCSGTPPPADTTPPAAPSGVTIQ